MSILVLTAANQLLTVPREGKLVKVIGEKALLLSPRGATFVRAYQVGDEWLPCWDDEEELSDDELTANEEAIIAAIKAMK